jgi:hypothetical protein
MRPLFGHEKQVYAGNMIVESNVAEFRADLTNLLRSFEEKYSLRFFIGSIHYNDAGLSFKIEAKSIVDGEALVDPYTEASAQKYLLLYGHEKVEKIIGSTVMLEYGAQGVVTDFSNRRKNAPFLVRIKDTEYWVPLGSIKKFVGKK